MRAARGCAQRLLLPASAGICRGTRASEAARPDFHRPSSLRQPPAAGGAVARGDSGGPPARPAADAEARAVGGQAEAEHQQAASRAQGLPVPSARQDDRPAEPGVGRRHNLHRDATGFHARYCREVLATAAQDRAAVAGWAVAYVPEINNLRAAALSWSFGPEGVASIGVALAAAS